MNRKWDVFLIVFLLCILTFLASCCTDVILNLQTQTAQQEADLLAELAAISAIPDMSAKVQSIIDIEEIWGLEDARSESDVPLVTQMRSQDGVLGYDRTSQTFYCPILPLQEDWPEIDLFGGGATPVQVVWVDDYSFDLCEEAVRKGYRYELFAYTDTQYSYFGVVFTGLPVVTLHVSGGVDELADVYTPARATVTAPGYDGIDQRAMTHLRSGGEDRQFPKLGYRVEFHDVSRKGRDTSKHIDVLGMGEDSDWVLLSNVKDDTCLRSELGWALWRRWGSNFHQLALRQVELFVDDSYVGIYQLANRVRYADEIVRMGGNPQTDFAFRMEHYKKEEGIPAFDCYGFEHSWLDLLYCPPGKSEADAGRAIEPYLYLMRPEISDEDFAKAASEYVDIAQMLDYYLYLSTAGLGKNSTFHNLFVYALRQGDGSYRYVLAPWDLDMTYQDEKGVFTAMIQPIRMLDLNVNNCRETFWQIWETRLAGPAAPQALYDSVIACQDALNASGAYLRESALWQADYGGAKTLSVDTEVAFAYDHTWYIDEYFRERWPLTYDDVRDNPLFGDFGPYTESATGVSRKAASIAP